MDSVRIAMEKFEKQAEGLSKRAEKYRDEVRDGTTEGYRERHIEAAKQVRDMIRELDMNRELAMFYDKKGEAILKDERPIDRIPFHLTPDNELNDLAEGFETAARLGIGARELHQKLAVKRGSLDIAKELLSLKKTLDADPDLARIFYSMENESFKFP